MPDERETTDGGSEVFRHGERRVPRRPSRGDPAQIRAISEHIGRHLGPPDRVLHELESDLVHVDVHIVSPRPGREFFTLVTSGMSEAPMVGPGLKGPVLHYAELVIGLPADWPLTMEALREERNFWPIGWLKKLARFPHEYDTWLGQGHTVPNGDPPQPFGPGTGFCCLLLASPATTPEEFDVLEIHEAKRIEFFALYALYREEMALKLRAGTDALHQRLHEAGVTEIVDVHRPNTCPRPWRKKS